MCVGAARLDQADQVYTPVSSFCLFLDLGLFLVAMSMVLAEGSSAK